MRKREAVGLGAAAILLGVWCVSVGLSAQTRKLATTCAEGLISACPPPRAAEFVRAPGAMQIPPIVNPNGLSFTASPDHSALVTQYQVIVYPAGSSAAVRSVPIGKPTPDLSGNITYMQFSTIRAGLPAGSYTAKISADGTGGSTLSAASDPFTQAIPPAAPGKPLWIQ